MTAIAGVVGVVVLDMTGLTFRIMVTIEAKIIIMIKGRRLPGIDAMALATVAFDLPMQIVIGVTMTTIALFTYIHFNQLMGETADWSKRHHTIVITVTCHTLLFREILMKSHTLFLAANRQSFGRLDTDLRHFMAGHTLFWLTANEWGVTSEAVVRKLLMALDWFPRGYHQMRHGDRQSDQHHKVQGYNQQ
jgi:hypothetical protein